MTFTVTITVKNLTDTETAQQVADFVVRELAKNGTKAEAKITKGK